MLMEFASAHGGDLVTRHEVHLVWCGVQAPQGMVTRHAAGQHKLTDGLSTRESSFTGFSLPEDSKISSCTLLRGRCPCVYQTSDSIDKYSQCCMAQLPPGLCLKDSMCLLTPGKISGFVSPLQAVSEKELAVIASPSSLVKQHSSTWHVDRVTDCHSCVWLGGD